MENIEQIKSKLQQFFDDFEYINSPNEAIDKFKVLFDNEYFVENINKNSPYYKSSSEKIYIKNGYGLGIEKISGPGDFLTPDKPSHHGIDVYVFSAIADEYIPLFVESKKESLNKQIDKLYNFDFSTKNLLSINDDLIFKSLPENIRNSEEIVLGRYENLKIDSKMKHENDIEDDLISYYGGLDVEIHETEYYLYESLLKYIDDKAFMNKVMPLFNNDFPDYLNEQIDECEHALYIIEHIDKYLKIADLSDKMEQLNTAVYYNKETIDEYTNEIKNIQPKLDEALSQLNELENKKYNIFNLILGQKYKDLDNINKLKTTISEYTKILEKTESEKDKLEDSSNYFCSEIEKFKDEKNELMSKLEKPFKDFTLDPEFEDETYVDGKYYMITSLNRLEQKKDEFMSKLQELKMMKSFDNSNELTVKKEQEKAIKKKKQRSKNDAR